MQDTRLGISKIFAFFFLENSVGCLGSRKENYWHYISVFENTPKKLISKSNFSLKLLQLYLVVQGRVQLEYSNHLVKVGVEATC